MDADPTFLGFGAFETTAFLTAVLVAVYSLLNNPTGRQGASDQAEYQVYAGWRLGLVVILTQLALAAIVLAVQLQQPLVAARAKVWLLLLMVAPWAPLAGKLRDNVTAAAKVRRMMKSRLIRNELTATLRDRFKFGQRALTLSLVIDHVIAPAPSPTDAAADATLSPSLAALRSHPVLQHFERELAEAATANAQTDHAHALALGVLWTVNQGGQPRSLARSTVWLWRAILRVDVLARAWTGRDLELHADPMPQVCARSRVMDRALVLDVVDAFQLGGTVSDGLLQRTMADAFCERCQLATRAGVEAFLESAAFGHTDLRAGTWLRDVEMDWRGNFERVIDVMWEAAFIEGGGIKIEGKEDKSRSFGDRNKVTTTKAFALLFVLARTLMRVDGDAACYASISTVVQAGPATEQWWRRYWDRVADKLKISARAGKHSDVEDGGEVSFSMENRAMLKGVLRDIIDEDMDEVVSELIGRPIDGDGKNSLCHAEPSCFLHGAKLLVRRVD